MAEFDQEEVIRSVTERVVAKHPSLDQDELAAVVREAVGELADKPVRDYVAVLAERAVKKRLKDADRS